MNHILLVEDDKALSNGICLALGSGELTLSQCFDLRSAREACQETAFDLLILDINLPDGNGLDFLKELRCTQSTAVILLTANDMETDIVSGLELGANDYMTKPFSLAILRARVNTQLRQAQADRSGRFQIDDFRFDFGRMEFFKKEQAIELSKTEQKLLRCLLENRGTTLPRDVLLARIWPDGADYVDENALSVSVKRLRAKLEDHPSKPIYIKTVYGLGYSWAVKQ